MSETLLVYVPDLGQGVSFYQALGLALEELLPEREALLSPLEGPLLLLRPGEGGVARGPQRPRPEGQGFARLRVASSERPPPRLPLLPCSGPVSFTAGIAAHAGLCVGLSSLLKRKGPRAGASLL